MTDHLCHAQSIGCGQEGCAGRAGQLASCCPALLPFGRRPLPFGHHSANPLPCTVQALARPMYSNPPVHGALLVHTILADPELKKQWCVCVCNLNRIVID